MGRRSSDTEEESRSRRKKKHRRRSSSSSSSSSRTYSRKKSGRKSRSRSRSRDLQSWSHSYEKRCIWEEFSQVELFHFMAQTQVQQQLFLRLQEEAQPLQGQREILQIPKIQVKEQDQEVAVPGAAAILQPQQREVRPQENPQRVPGAPQGPGQGQGQGQEQREGQGGSWHQGWGLCKHQSWIRTSAKADEALKAKERSEEEAKRRKEEDQASLLDQVKRVKEIEAIESDAFVPQTFRSSKEVKKSTEAPEAQQEPVNVGTGAPEAAEKEPPAANIPTAIKYQDDNSLAHPNRREEKRREEKRREEKRREEKRREEKRREEKRREEKRREESSEPLPGPEGAPGELEREWGQGLEGQDTGNGFAWTEGRAGWEIGKEFLAEMGFPDLLWLPLDPWSAQGQLEAVAKPGLTFDDLHHY
ncbi:hypothetical protein HGM15179_015883 [Zosterops borbonicus]|uniref:Uncharacterized protein n=1 Tax=Zosterops borbonicus TaxID=364589 RepID=A0A8K1G3P7_9PASS|nr:hypothetical protein HGM15179_015883 [Zosterops borbonicus]